MPTMSHTSEPDQLMACLDPTTRFFASEPVLKEKGVSVIVDSKNGRAKNINRALSLVSLLAAAGRSSSCVPDLLRYYIALRKSLSEKAKAGHCPEATRTMETIRSTIGSCYSSLGDLIQNVDKPALISPSGDGLVITHKALKATIRDFNLPVESRPGNPRHPTVAIALPNGPLLAATCIAVSSRYVAAPINAAVGAQQFYADVDQVKAECVLTTPEVAEKLELTEAWAKENNTPIFFVKVQDDGSFKLTNFYGDLIRPGGVINTPHNKSDDTCILLFTSGTSGTKKIVPLSLHLVVAGAILVIDSWGLSESDICLNMMPLFHM